ncbi:MAG: gamma-glutamyl-gamma-aminobutyrate hydrolase family protein [Bacillota bacterium]
MKPKILISCYHVAASELQNKRVRGVIGQDMEMCTWDYIAAVQKSGGLPFMIPNIADDDNIHELLSMADGILFSGGEDVYPGYYDERIEVENILVSEKRDSFEIKLARKAFAAGVPILGICRGMQLLNVAAGGALYQDIYEQLGIELKHSGHGQERYNVIHNVDISVPSKLNDILGVNRLGVNSYHHQAVRILAEGFAPTAYSEDGLLEAYEVVGSRFLIGVQWHPEMMFMQCSEQRKIFDAFVKEACRYMTARVR